MNNEEVLSEFEEWLQTQRIPEQAGRATASQVLSIVREFADAIGPMPLGEATVKERNDFLRRHKAPSVDATVNVTNAARFRAKVEKAEAERRYGQVQYAMLLFGNFCDSVLKNGKGE